MPEISTTDVGGYVRTILPTAFRRPLYYQLSIISSNGVLSIHRLSTDDVPLYCVRRKRLMKRQSYVVEIVKLSYTIVTIEIIWTRE